MFFCFVPTRCSTRSKRRCQAHNLHMNNKRGKSYGNFDIVFLQTNWNWTNCLVGLPKTSIYEYKPRTNGCNIVGQQILKSVDVECCVLLHKKLLSVVGNCCAKFETGQTFEPTSPHISLVPSSPKCSATMCWIRLHIPFKHSWGHKRALHMISLKTATH